MLRFSRVSTLPLVMVTALLAVAGCARGPDMAPPTFAMAAGGAEGGPSMTDAEIAARGTGAGQPERSTRPRLFGFLFQRTPGEVEAAPSPTEVMLAEAGDTTPVPSMTDEEIAARGTAEIGETVETASVDEAVETGSTGTPAAAPRPRLFGFLFQPRPGTPGDTGDLEPLATPDQFGLMMRACDVARRDLGTKVDTSPGNGTYTLYDTAPSSPAPRVQYVTGFRDGCPRRVFAALTLFGSPVVHETKRYDPSNTRPYTLADDAYEDVKRRVCGVRKGTFCPPNRLDRLGRDVALLTAYPSFGDNGQWLDVVLFRGELAGQSIEN